MEQEKKLYPFSFCTLQDDYPWGEEEFKLADLGYRDSLVREGWLAGNSLSELMDTYLDRVVGDNVYDYYGRQFPLCVRVLHVHGRMPLRVHPDDETAAQRYDFLGKEKLWYVLRCAPEARLMAGFRRDTDASEFFAACQDGSVEGLLNVVTPQAGMFLRIPAGTPHAAAGEVEILEIGESSPMDFCLCGWGGEVHPDEFDPALTLVDALDFIDYKQFASKTLAPGKKGTSDAAPGAERLLDLPQMRVDRLRLDASLAASREAGPFVLYCCLDGAASVQLPLAGGAVDFPVRSGQTLLVPAECEEYRLVPLEKGTVLLECTVLRADADPYINPAADPTPPDGE